VLCYRCGGHVKDGSDQCASCGQQFAPGTKPGPAAGFGVGNRRHRVAVEGAPYRAGDVVAGRFQIRDHAGQGPLGWMFRAVELATDNPVALKVLSPRFLQTAEEKRVFLADQQKAQRLSHQNIARVYQAGEDQERPFIALQLLEGLTLRRIMELRRQKGQGFSLQEVEPIVAQIAAALEAAAGTFAHGNLKPDNVVVLPDLLKLTDFGLAGSLPRAPFMAAQRAAGVHRYLAPEFLLGEPLDARTDVFSLGVLLGELLGGAHQEAQLSLLAGRPQLLPRVEDIYRRAVAQRPADRFANAGELLAELSSLLSSAPAPRAAAPMGEDAGDVVIEEVHTDPRVRIARALAAQDAAPLQPAPFVAPPPYEPGAPRREPVRSQDEVTARHETPIALRAQTVPPPEERSEPLREELPARLGETATRESQPAMEIPSREEPSSREAAAEAKLIEVAARVGATPALLTAETAVRAAPTAPAQAEPSSPPEPVQDDGASRPRRGAGKRGKEKHSKPPRPRRGAGADAASDSSTPPPVASSLPPPSLSLSSPPGPAVASAPLAIPSAPPAVPSAPPPAALTSAASAPSNAALAASSGSAPPAFASAPPFASASASSAGATASFATAAPPASSIAEGSAAQKSNLPAPAAANLAGPAAAPATASAQVYRSPAAAATALRAASSRPPASQPAATEGALATGPATSALVPIQPERSVPPARRSRPPSPRSSPPSFGALVEEKKRPKAFMIATVSIVAVAMLVAASTFFGGGSKAAAEPGQVATSSTGGAGNAAAPSPAAAVPAAAPVKPAASPTPAAAAPKAPPKPEPKAELSEPAPEQAKARASDHRSLREKIGAVREAAHHALEARQRKRDEALAKAESSRAEARRSAEHPAVVEHPAVAEQPTAAVAVSAEAQAPKASPASAVPQASATATALGAALSSATASPGHARPLPPAGAINSADDMDLLASKKGKLVAYAASSESACPPGMQRIKAGAAQIGSDAKDDLRNFGDRLLATVEVRSYCIDSYEYPNTAGRLPQVAAGWNDADAACKNAGKRLCSEEEWEKACKGPESARFPYGMNFDPNACNTQDAKDNPRAVAAVGSFGKCKSGYGVWDMSGNAAEWTATSFDETGGKTVKGGHASRPGFDDRCASRRKLPPGQHDAKVGFRCCADAR
jgi:serine/threonine protein kinase/formylglycine-generating enzyme required for sulfatase activity